MAWFEHGAARIYYEDYGSGDPVLLVPGWSGSIEEFSALRESLVAAGYRVIEADLPGSGRSEPQPRVYSAAYFEEDADSFMALLQHLGVAPAHLMGFSDGGEDALLMAALNPAVARSVAAWGAVGLINDPEGNLRNMLYNVVDQPIPMVKEYSEQLIARYGAVNARAMTRNVVAAYSAIVEAGSDISLSKVGNITCPVLLITGEQDFFATPALVSELADRIPNARMLEAKDAGHEQLHATRPEWMAQILLDWLKTH